MKRCIRIGWLLALLPASSARADGNAIIVEGPVGEIQDPCPGKRIPGWRQSADGPQSPVGGLTASRKGRRIRVEGSFKVGTFDLCTGTWAYSEAQKTSRVYKPGKEIGGGAVLHPGTRPSQSSYDFFDTATMVRSNGKTVGPSVRNAPSGRTDYVIAHTGAEVIVWGGSARSGKATQRWATVP